MNIRNVITTANLNQRVDITKLIKYSWGIYDLQYYGGRCGYVKDDNITGRVTVFLSGKMISTGATTIPKSIEQLEHTTKLLVREKFVKRTRLEPKVQNIVATGDIESKIDLNRMTSTPPNLFLNPSNSRERYTEVDRDLPVLSLHLVKL